MTTRVLKMLPLRKILTLNSTLLSCLTSLIKHNFVVKQILNSIEYFFILSPDYELHSLKNHNAV
ncbi:MAG: hypothetical protein CR988_01570 [Treponema sp.]|nr:MAG: hypothetical protein CR988_01570 [Treponema sp.]